MSKCMSVYALQYRSETLQRETINVYTACRRDSHSYRSKLCDMGWVAARIKFYAMCRILSDLQCLTNTICEAMKIPPFHSILLRMLEVSFLFCCHDSRTRRHRSFIHFRRR